MTESSTMSPRRTCPTGKVRFRNKLDAKIAMASTQRAKGSNREENRTYRCEMCHGWHLTSQKRRRGK